jgi:hypothetical protein
MALTFEAPEASSQTPVLRIAVSTEEVSACFTLMQLLRPHLKDAQELVARWRRQQEQNYNLLIAWHQDCPLGLAGYRYQETLLHGPHLYVDDLVTSDRVRRSGYGSLLLNQLKSDAAARGLHFWAELNEEPNAS